jgi:hypothetical protein
MQADYALELGREDPALEVPWSSQNDDAGGASRYYDLKSHPDLVVQIPEAAGSPELSAFLTRINAATFPLQTVKCDAWYGQKISPEEEIFGTAGKFVSYIDLVFSLVSSEDEPRLSLQSHEALAKNLCTLLKRAPEMAAMVELIIRRCYFHPDGKPDESADGFCISAYVSGFGDSEPEARQRWGIALTLLQHALVQVVRQ